jgi:hypothetical protein
MSRTLPFTKASIRRAVKGVESAGMKVRRITLNADGSLTFDGVDGAPLPVDKEAGLATSWDDV